ncbi:class I SAM-dependent methyltransferase [Asanoa sp. WMMD1127]|uniref:class I SAM-dependent methyltransferase n=1 Tax=Asanoa sp. WMMD1127 TaxID=3016107 RepID=UPI002415B7D7|nr:class I SAM-dependent methyltransferase [Asanoa sp. WMMD1127]MDG4823973.1 class I SAM-dependent methyltransferase [Asanoa sp. WMMD1127]
MTEHRFYGDLAPWWPLISPAEDYAEEAAFAATLLGDATTTVLELGSGGGHNAVHLKKHFDLTLVDLAPGMLAQSQKINPELVHHRGDMRTVRLDQQFDAVFVHDAVDYMTSEADLRQAVATAFAHTRPHGRAVFVPDATTETFAPETDHGGIDAPDGRGARYLSWSYDPDPTDTTILTAYAFLLRDETGRCRAVDETHETGLFPTDTWLRLLHEAGYAPRAVTEETSEDRPPRTFFIGVKGQP